MLTSFRNCLIGARAVSLPSQEVVPVIGPQDADEALSADQRRGLKIAKFMSGLSGGSSSRETDNLSGMPPAPSMGGVRAPIKIYSRDKPATRQSVQGDEGASVRGVVGRGRHPARPGLAIGDQASIRRSDIVLVCISRAGLASLSIAMPQRHFRFSALLRKRRVKVRD